MVSDLLVYTTYRVTYSSLTSDVRCECYLFQSNGILCCHILAVLMKLHIIEVPSRYILPRWSRNVHRKHTQINTSHDVKRSNESMNIFRGLCSHFYNVAQDFVSNLEEAAILHDAMEGARPKLKAHKESNQLIFPVGVHDLLGPQRVPTRGRPSTTRLGAKRDRAIKKKPHVIRGSYTYNVEANLKFIILSNSNSNPRSFEHQFHPLIKGIIGRIKRRLIED
ncbi:hypothetical protein PIB30_085854 [Stylosanthes scabra]|uniref:SWIM-type domain-containing protein n=1 Tax=Stylosanthes scabra TaxID=79078 RepID=A0ABU6RU82_9FABA|nr:hypothetical protein [Stylosanthes scabra]